MKKILLMLGIIMLFAVGLRLYPSLISEMPFSTDAWSPIKNAELLMQNTPIALNDKIFDGYNNYWPINSIFGALISEIILLPPIDSMSLLFPIIGALSILIFYAIVNIFTGPKISLLASLLFGTAFSHTYFTAGITKETYASPIYLLHFCIYPPSFRPFVFFLFTSYYRSFINSSSDLTFRFLHTSKHCACKICCQYKKRFACKQARLFANFHSSIS